MFVFFFYVWIYVYVFLWAILLPSHSGPSGPFRSRVIKSIMRF